ncbi:DUF3097 domain-containing protein [Saccharomonospora piscinae]|uniref:DUF3097 domain-containing protein n=1 Tax=Saccharomonospora piscinae TaxID=687388 RepID=UPI001105A32B|nr:DUF3097 domain-containing protein [Saccharomonospora piscinae]TLW94543.1 DUF3097 domain-containing protein [Saccharomonospora piscinae]
MRAHDYDDVLAAPRRRRRRPVPEVSAEPGLVVEDAASGFCGAVVGCERGGVTLEDRHGRRRVFPLAAAGFLLDGAPTTLVPPSRRAPAAPTRSASGSVRVAGTRARTARGSRIWVEGLHDAELVEHVWGHDLRVEGVVVEPLDGVDGLADRVAAFEPGPGRRLGVLVDHLVSGSKESRLAADLDHEHVLVTGHPYVDVWEAVKPQRLGIGAWPRVPRGVDWKHGVCAQLGWGEPAEGWRRVRSAVTGFRDLEPPLLAAVEALIDFVTADGP